MKQSTGVDVREGGGEQCCWLPTCPLPLLPLATTARQVAVVQHCRPASACRSLLSLRDSDSSAYTRAALSRRPHSFAARVYRLVRPHSFTHNPIRARRRPTDHTIRRHHALTSKFTLGNNHHRGHCLPIVRCLFLGTIRHLHLSLIGSHCCCQQSRPDLHLDAIAHS